MGPHPETSPQGRGAADCRCVRTAHCASGPGGLGSTPRHRPAGRHTRSPWEPQAVSGRVSPPNVLQRGVRFPGLKRNRDLQTCRWPVNVAIATQAAGAPARGALVQPTLHLPCRTPARASPAPRPCPWPPSPAQEEMCLREKHLPRKIQINSAFDGLENTGRAPAAGSRAALGLRGQTHEPGTAPVPAALRGDPSSSG